MQQQPPQMVNISPSFPPTAITTEQIQKYLDENKQLILAILENQNLGKLTECAHFNRSRYQAQLQKNLIYLAAIADAQPPAPTGPAQMPMHPAMQQGHYMQQQQQQQHPQQQQQPGFYGAKLPFQLTEQQQQQQQQHNLLLHLQQQQPMQGLMGLRPILSNGMQMGLNALGSGLVDLRGSKPDGSEVGSGDGQGKSGSGHGSGNRDS